MTRVVLFKDNSILQMGATDMQDDDAIYEKIVTMCKLNNIPVPPREDVTIMDIESDKLFLGFKSPKITLKDPLWP